MSKSRLEKILMSYEFLLSKEKNGQSFTVDEICREIGWKRSSVTTYISKKWENFVSKKGGEYYVNGISVYDKESYSRLMSQKDKLSNEPLRPVLSLEVERLIVKSREAALHALDGYNRPSTIFRTEAFTVMMVIAWRSLFHAIFESQGKKYTYVNDDDNVLLVDGEEKAWDLKKCLHEYFGSSTNPIRSNLNFIVELRNRIEHRYVPAIDPHVSGECQACVLNYDHLLVEKFGDYFALRESLVMPLQTSNLRSTTQMDAIKKFQGTQYEQLKEFLEDFRSALSDEIYTDQHYSFRVYLIPKTGNRRTSSDMAIEFIKPDNSEDMDDLIKRIVLIKERQVPVANPGMYKPTQVVLNVRLKIGRPFTIHLHTQAWKMYSVRKKGYSPDGCNTKYCQFDQVHKDYIYTEAWIDYLTTQLSSEQEYQKLKEFRDK